LAELVEALSFYLQPGKMEEKAFDKLRQAGVKGRA